VRFWVSVVRFLNRSLGSTPAETEAEDRALKDVIGRARQSVKELDEQDGARRKAQRKRKLLQRKRRLQRKRK
jgi:hypothetical protein